MNKKLVKRGQCILREKPFVYALSSKFRTERCDFCFKQGEVLKCSNCKYVYYCSRTCQKESWPMHKHECAYLGKILPQIVPDAARVIARILLKLKGNGADQKGFYTEQDYRKFKDLMPHYENLMKNPNRIEHIQSLIMVLKQLLGSANVPSDKEFITIYGRMSINSFNILDDELNSIGMAIYLGASICDHSCRPNAVATFVGTTLQIYAIEPMASLNWSKIRISYIDLVLPTVLRQRELSDNYFFRCDCDRCKDPREPIEMNAAACPNVKCSAPQYFDLKPLHCNNCQTKIDSAYIKSYEELLDCTKMHLGEMKDIACEYISNIDYSSQLFRGQKTNAFARYTVDLDVCTVMLKKQRNVFHPTNVWHIKTLDMAFESAINVGKLDLALDYGNVLVNGLRKYGGDFSPILGLAYAKIGKIQLLNGHVKEALHSLNQASEIVSVTHGRDHSLYRQNLVPLLIAANAECG